MDDNTLFFLQNGKWFQLHYQGIIVLYSLHSFLVVLQEILCRAEELWHSAVWWTHEAAANHENKWVRFLWQSWINAGMLMCMRSCHAPVRWSVLVLHGCHLMQSGCALLLRYPVGAVIPDTWWRKQECGDDNDDDDDRVLRKFIKCQLMISFINESAAPQPTNLISCFKHTYWISIQFPFFLFWLSASHLYGGHFFFHYV